MALLWDGRTPLRDQTGSLRRGARALGVFCFSLSFLGCSLDARTLEAASEGGGGGAGASSGGGAGQSAKPPPPVELPICEYPADNTIEPGCETLAENAGFTKDAKGWSAEDSAVQVAWETGDRASDPMSGSIAVVNTLHGVPEGIAASGGAQCLKAEAKAIYDMAADVFIPEGQGDGVMGGPYTGFAGLGLLFWPNADCSASSPTRGDARTNLVNATGVWSHVEGVAVAPEVAQSMSVRVLTVKPFRQFQFKAVYDNVLLRRRE